MERDFFGKSRFNSTFIKYKIILCYAKMFHINFPQITINKFVIFIFINNYIYISYLNNLSSDRNVSQVLLIYTCFLKHTELKSFPLITTSPRGRRIQQILHETLKMSTQRPVKGAGRIRNARFV